MDAVGWSLEANGDWLQYHGARTTEQQGASRLKVCDAYIATVFGREAAVVDVLGAQQAVPVALAVVDAETSIRISAY